MSCQPLGGNQLHTVVGTQPGTKLSYHFKTACQNTLYAVLKRQISLQPAFVTHSITEMQYNNFFDFSTEIVK